MNRLLSAQNISKSFHAQAQSVQVLNEINLEVRQGQSVAILGASGSGKSTLLQILGTIMRPDGGELTLEGSSLSALSNEALGRIRLNQFGFVFQFNNLLPDLSCLENVMLPALIKGIRPSKAADQARDLLKEVSLSHVMSTRAALLSGGEQQRAAMARALMNAPKILIADEPTGNLDRKNGDLIAEMMFALVEERGMAIIMATHDEDLASKTQVQFHLRAGKLDSQ